MPELNVDELTKILKDAAYITIGFGVLTFQRAQVQRRELEGQIRAQADEAREQLEKVTSETMAGWDKLSESVEDRLKLVEERLSDLEERIAGLLDDVESRLPDQAAEVVKQARAAAKDARTQVRSLVNRAA